MSLDPAALASAHVARLVNYDPGPDLVALRANSGGLVELGANESTYGPGPAALQAMRDALAEVQRYPDPRAGLLRQAVAARFALAADELVFGNGSHELLVLLCQTFAGPENPVVFSRYAFAVYRLCAASFGAPSIIVDALPREHPTAPLGHDLEAIARAITPATRLVLLANPNNPTGTWFEHDALEQFLGRVRDDVLVVVDEAYVEYYEQDGGVSALDLRARFPNLIVMRTFSKARGLAGQRIGWLTADARVCAMLERVRQIYNVNSVAQAGALASLGDEAWLAEVLAKNARERARLAAALADRGLPSLPSRANFLLADCGREAAAVARELAGKGVIVLPLAGYGLPGSLRISIGSAEENDRLLDALP